MKKFCFISVDYENHVPRGEQTPSIHNGLQSIAAQTFKDFNLIICHDGPKERTYEEEGINFKTLGLEPIILNTPERMNDWGHSSRDFAMKYAYENNLGEYYIQHNIDNVFYSHALETLNKDISENPAFNIFIFNIIHMKLGGSVLRGIPPAHCQIDAMQMVAHKDIWRDSGFWYNKENSSDGMIYQDICSKNIWLEVPVVLGINY